MNNLDKNSIINMENTAKYQPRSKLNVSFSTADRDSAVFVFNVTKDNKPLLLSTENVTGHIALKHSDGSFVKDTLHFTEPDINGRFEYYLPNDILKREGTVTMQIFISEKGNSNVTVAERIVTFDIEKSIISQISAETKLQYIVEYDELQAIIANRITDIEDNMANAEDYVSQLEQVREKGLTDIEIAKTDNIKTLNDLADIRLEEMNSKASEYSSKFDADKQYMDEKHESFKESVLNSEVVTQGESEEWQKHKMTQSNGDRIRISDINPVNLESGYYQMWRMKNAPVGNDDSGTYWNIDVTTAFDDVKQIKAVLSYTGQTFQKNIHKGNDSGWKKLVSLPLDEEIETQNSAESRANETLTDANQYTDEQINNKHFILFDGNVSGTGKGFTLDDDIYNYNMLFVSGEFPGGVFTEPVLVKTIDNDLVIQRFNLSDDSGSLSKFYETLLTVIDNKNLKIKHDIAYNFETSKAISSSNVFAIYRIEGWK
ncbi:BppU family phage baseplate upper protein [Staphylococcus sp. GDY8P131P]|uniref:BppU family phage baseplate upper protein n=1 Tax=Staphylococcus sp. GDY8P131P TaxID=2804159 RepID=UPI001AEC6345|nr:BppU family phage baseplate upper protein [Staphylococcus sp. GDY8P131P]